MCQHFNIKQLILTKSAHFVFPTIPTAHSHYFPKTTKINFLCCKLNCHKSFNCRSQQVLSSEVRRPGRIADRSSPSSVRVKNEWSHSPTPLHTFPRCALHDRYHLFASLLTIFLRIQPPSLPPTTSQSNFTSSFSHPVTPYRCSNQIPIRKFLYTKHQPADWVLY